MKTPLSTWYRASILFALMATVACGDDPVAPGIEPEIVNNTDAFSYQIRDLSDVGGSWDYTWQTTGTLAQITHATNSPTGTSGAWTVTVTYTGYTNDQVNFELSRQ